MSKEKTKKFDGKKDPMNSREVVRRNELTPIIKDIVSNVNTMAKHLMDDVNTLFKRFVYPTMMRTNAIENVLIKKGVLTKEDINEETKFLTEEAIKKAKEVDENGKAKAKETGAPNEGIKAEETAKIEVVDEGTPEEEEIERVEAEIVSEGEVTKFGKNK